MPSNVGRDARSSNKTPSNDLPTPSIFQRPSNAFQRQKTPFQRLPTSKTPCVFRTKRLPTSFQHLPTSPRTPRRVGTRQRAALGVRRRRRPTCPTPGTPPLLGHARAHTASACANASPIARRSSLAGG